MHFQKQVSGGSFGMAWAALSGKSDYLSGIHALRDTDIQGMFGEHGASLAVEFGHAQCQAANGAMIGIFQVEHDFGMMIFAPHPVMSLPGAAAHATHLSAE